MGLFSEFMLRLDRGTSVLEAAGTFVVDIVPVVLTGLVTTVFVAAEGADDAALVAVAVTVLATARAGIDFTAVVFDPVFGPVMEVGTTIFFLVGSSSSGVLVLILFFAIGAIGL